VNRVESKLARIEKAINDFGGLVHEFRIGNNLSLQEMAELTSLSSSYICRIENSKRKPDLDVRVRILTLGMNWSTVDIHFYLEQIIAKRSMAKKL
jgi:transcriptional regulator with XRE-family HTH domain